MKWSREADGPIRSSKILKKFNYTPLDTIFKPTIINRKVKYNPTAMSSASLDLTFTALADPTRRAILARLARGELAVTELAKPFNMSLPAITKHLKVLERAGLISRSRHAQWRPCKLQAKPLSEVANYVEEYRQFWEQSFDRLDEYLKELQAEEQSHGSKSG